MCIRDRLYKAQAESSKESEKSTVNDNKKTKDDDDVQDVDFEEVK